MKKISFSFLLLIGGIIICICVAAKSVQKRDLFNEPYAYYPTLLICKQEVEDEHVYIVKRDAYFANLPLAKVLTGLGISIEWLDKDTGRFTANEKEYLLSLTDEAIYEVGTSVNCIVPGDGLAIINKRVYDGVSDLYVDNYCLVATLGKMGIEIDINWDTQAQVISISKGKGQGNMSVFLDP